LFQRQNLWRFGLLLLVLLRFDFLYQYLFLGAVLGQKQMMMQFLSLMLWR